MAKSTLIKEQNITTNVGFTGTTSTTSGDTYATGDARLPKLMGKVVRRSFPEKIFHNELTQSLKTNKRKKHRKKKSSAK